jgi:hypothetical protein
MSKSTIELHEYKELDEYPELGEDGKLQTALDNRKYYLARYLKGTDEKNRVIKEVIFGIFLSSNSNSDIVVDMVPLYARKGEEIIKQVKTLPTGNFHDVPSEFILDGEFRKTGVGEIEFFEILRDDRIYSKLHKKFIKKMLMLMLPLKKGTPTKSKSRKGGSRKRMSRRNKTTRLPGCRIVKGNKETCCINPKRGFWCWSKGITRKISTGMKRNCCKNY